MHIIELEWKSKNRAVRLGNCGISNFIDIFSISEENKLEQRAFILNNHVHHLLSFVQVFELSYTP